MGLVNAAGGESTASNCPYVIYFARGIGDDGKPFLLADGVGVGYGARPFADGIDTVYYIAQENYPAELLELSYPVRLRAYGVHRDSGGPGRWRGGCGVVREIEVLAERATFSIRIDGVSKPAWGVYGGKNGGAGRAVVNPGTPKERELEPFSDGNVLRRGDVLRLETGGGGGWGHPWDRDPKLVLDDVLGGFVSREAAEREYGVLLSEDGEAVDEPATRERRAHRPPMEGLFHRETYRDELE
jgi:N-methylhydantoinase B